MKRHTRPYGCTFRPCKKSFGSKNDWRRHENSQHFHLETWRCDVTPPSSSRDTVCLNVYYRQQNFQAHLELAHGLTKNAAVEKKFETCRLGRHCQSRFWCGFCAKSVELKRKGIEAWNERFDHIDDHYMGRNGNPPQTIQDWAAVDENEAESEFLVMSCLLSEPGSSSSSDSASSESSSSSSSSEKVPVAAPAHAKRRAEGSADERPAKQPRSKTHETAIYCVSLSFPSLPPLGSHLHRRCSD